MVILPNYQQNQDFITFSPLSKTLHLRSTANLKIVSFLVLIRELTKCNTNSKNPYNQTIQIPIWISNSILTI